MNNFFERLVQDDMPSAGFGIDIAALQLHNKALQAYKSDSKAVLGFYGSQKNLKSLMPLPFLRKSGVVRFIVNKVKGLRKHKNKKVINSSLILKPAHSKRVKLKRYIHRLVRRRS